MVNTRDLVLALLLPLPPWLGFLIHRYRGRLGLAYGYFLGGVLAVLALPWPQIGGHGLPAAHLGGTLFGFTLFLQAHRDGRKGVRSLALGVAGATLFGWLIGTQLGLDMRSVLAFWATALLEAGLWLVLSDLGYRVTQGRYLSLRMPLAGGAAFLVATALYRFLPLGITPLSWLASILAGLLLGLVALQQLSWLRAQGVWVEGRGDGFRVALSALEGDQPADDPALAYVIEARQPMFLVDHQGLLLETNTPFSRLAGLPRHQMKGYQLQDLFQGRDGSPWEDLHDQLLREFRGSVQATLVHRDSSFQSVKLEAVTFDRNMALVWIAEAQPGTLALRGEGGEALAQARLAGNDPQRLAAEAVAAILPAADQILADTWNGRTRAAAEQIIVAVQRLVPATGRHSFTAPVSELPSAPALEAMLPRLQRMLRPGQELIQDGQELVLFMEPEPLRRILTHLVLHGSQALDTGSLILRLVPVTLGNRAWARLDLLLNGSLAPRGAEALGLTWLQQTVRDSLGMLELRPSPWGSLWPRVYLPCQSQDPDPASHCLAGRRIWIYDRDPDLRSTLCDRVRGAGAEATGHPDLRSLLAATRTQPRPDLLVLERTPALERFQRRLQKIEKRPLPALILGDGRGLPPGEPSPSQLMLIEKPFPGQNFLQSLLALLQGS